MIDGAGQYVRFKSRCWRTISRSARPLVAVAVLANSLAAADRHNDYPRAEIWHGSKLVVPAREPADTTSVQANIPNPSAPREPNVLDQESAPVSSEPSVPAEPDVTEPAWSTLEPLRPQWEDFRRLPRPAESQESGNAANRAERLDGATTADDISGPSSNGEHEMSPSETRMPGGLAPTAPVSEKSVSEKSVSEKSVPEISVTTDSDYEIHAQPSLQGSKRATGQGTSVQPLSFHFTIEGKGDQRREPSPDGKTKGLTTLPESPQRTSGEARQATDNGAHASGLREYRAWSAIGAFALGLFSFPLLFSLCAFVYLRRRVNTRPLFRVELVNPNGGEQPYEIGLGRVRFSEKTDAAESAASEDEPARPQQRQGTVIDEAVPIAPLGPTYDEQKREEAQQRRELEQAMLEAALEQNLKLFQQLDAENGR